MSKISRKEINKGIQRLKLYTPIIADKEEAKCLAVGTDLETALMVACPNSVSERRHTISRVYLNQMSDANNNVLWTLPLDATHIAHHAYVAPRHGNKIGPIPPKNVPVPSASTWFFACEKHDALFNPIDQGINFFGHQRDIMGENLFLLAYRTVLSTASTVRGARRAAYKLRIDEGNHRSIAERESTLYKAYEKVNTQKLMLDNQLLCKQFSMTHHIASVKPHTRIAISQFEDDRCLNVLPNGEFTWVIISHSSKETEVFEQQASQELARILSSLEDPTDCAPLIDLLSSRSPNAYISPDDYSKWTAADQDVLCQNITSYLEQYMLL